MLTIGNPTPDLEIEALMPDGRFEHLRAGRSCCFIPRTSPSSARPRPRPCGSSKPSRRAGSPPRVAPGRWLVGRGLKAGGPP